jgi:serine/threonine-protein kinase RsbW
MVRQLDLLPARLEQLRTAVAEAVLNAMEHGNQYRPGLPVAVRVVVSEEALMVRVIDQGVDGPIAHPPEPDLMAKLAGKQPARGWGLFLIKRLADDMRLISCEGEHTVELLWYLDEARGENGP